jgi:GDPmannose 4,6-dehydratase
MANFGIGTLEGPTLVTGALGQDGLLLCRRLRALGAEVCGVVRPGGGRVDRRHILTGVGCRLVDLDLGDTAALADLVAQVRPAHIFHLAAAHHASDSPPETPRVWQAMIAVNLLATEAIARTCVTEGIDCSLVYASSSQVWTAHRPEHCVDEMTPLEPASFYGQTKAWASDLLRRYRARHGLRAAIAVLFNHESPWRDPSFVSRRISMAAAQAATGKREILTLANIGARVDWQAAADVIEGLLLMAASEVPDDYVLASGQSHSVRDFLDAAFGHVGIDWKDLVAAKEDAPGPALVGVPGKAIAQLGWRPRRAFDQLVRGMVDADVARLQGVAAQ